MGAINQPEQPVEIDNPSVGGDILDNVRRLRGGDGSWRFEGGALIITDENGDDRVLIGYQEDGF